MANHRRMGLAYASPSMSVTRRLADARRSPSSSAVPRIRCNEDSNVLLRKVRRGHLAQIDMSQDGRHIEAPRERSLRPVLTVDDELHGSAIGDVDRVQAARYPHDPVGGIGLGRCAVNARVVALQAAQW